jgi:hypothetical protein
MKGDQLYLRHILEAIEKIESYISVGRDVFMSATHWQDAVIRLRAHSDGLPTGRSWTMVIAPYPWLVQPG